MSFPASGRRTQLEALGFLNQPVSVKCHASQASSSRNPSYLNGSLNGGTISYTAGRQTCHVSPAAFVEHAGHQLAPGRELQLIKLPSGISLAVALAGKDQFKKWNKKNIEEHLQDEENVTKLADLGHLFKKCRDASIAAALSEVVYRVCRQDEDPDAIRSSGLQLQAGRSWRDGHGDAAPAADYFYAISEHVKEGSNPKRTRQPFISATRDLTSAMHWAYAGVLTIVEVDLAKCRRHGIMYWEVWRDHALLYGTAANFSTSSTEVILDGPVPADCCKILQTTWTLTNLVRSRNLRDRKLFAGLRVKLVMDPRSDMEVLEVLDAGSTKPLKVKLLGKEATYVMKRGGLDAVPNPAHMSSEFTALTLYEQMGVCVPKAALLYIKVKVESLVIRTAFLLTQFLEGNKFELDKGIKNSYDNWEAIQGYVQDTCAADLAMANFDVCGPDGHNLLVSKGKVYRIDVGGALSFLPNGGSKPEKYWRPTKSAVQATVTAFSNGVPSNSVSTVSRIRGKYSAADAVKLVFAHTIRAEGVLAGQARHFLETLKKTMNVWLDQYPSFQDARAFTDYAIVQKRLSWLAASVPNAPHRPPRQPSHATLKRHVPQGNGSSPVAKAPRIDQPEQPGQLHELLANNIFVEKRRSAFNQNQPQGFWPNFKKKYVDKGYEIIDLTSKADAEWRMLSPFFPHENIPIPGAEHHVSASLEGIWQGLKVFGKDHGVDEESFKNTRERGLKRTKRQVGMAVKGHWYGEYENIPTDEAEPDQLLGYVEARKKIYVPALLYVIEHHLRPEGKLAKIAQLACERKVVLLDYYINGNVNNEDEPLSHAAMIKQYMVQHAELLM